MQVQDFQEIVWDYYRDHARSMPWRDAPSSYNVVVSEFMLQQTQVSRVEPKFREWVEAWPDFGRLANASVADVLAAWKGLGYNRRALRLKEVARIVAEELGGVLPRDIRELQALPGIGAGTAGAIAAYAWNSPVVFIDTNIRRVFLHHFFTDRDDVADKELLPLIEAALDYEHPREWYWALMDYGSWLKTQVVNPNRRSRHYARQGKFAGSHRQLRGLILERAMGGAAVSRSDDIPGFESAQIDRALQELAVEGFLVRYEDGFTIKI